MKSWAHLEGKINLLEEKNIRLLKDKMGLVKEVEKWKSLAKEAVLEVPTMFLTSDRKELREFAEYIVRIQEEEDLG